LKKIISRKYGGWTKGRNSIGLLLPFFHYTANDGIFKEDEFVKKQNFLKSTKVYHAGRVLPGSGDQTAPLGIMRRWFLRAGGGTDTAFLIF
jgi:hypothetical protein